ncbi:hypothetical protein ColTof4_13614 [Colletotrichum tofieldiae]|nr:hypothetical protein ColTof4_13614 [Colletotrichum tofieldiae]
MDLRVAGVDAEEDNGEETGTREALSSELCRSPLTIRAAERNVDRILSLILAQAVLAASSPQEVPFRRWSRTLGLAIFPSTPQSQMMAEAPHDASLQAHGGKGANGKVAGDGDMVLRKLIHGASQLQVACVVPFGEKRFTVMGRCHVRALAAGGGGLVRQATLACGPL